MQWSQRSCNQELLEGIQNVLEIEQNEKYILQDQNSQSSLETFFNVSLGNSLSGVPPSDSISYFSYMSCLLELRSSNTKLVKGSQRIDCRSLFFFSVSAEIWIAVGVACGVFLLILIFVVVLLLRRRRKQAEQRNG